MAWHQMSLFLAKIDIEQTHHDGTPLDAFMRETENYLRLSCAPDNQMSLWWGERRLTMSWLFYKCCRSRECLSVCLGLDPLPCPTANGEHSVPERAAPEISHHILSNLERSCFEVQYPPACNIQCFSIPENALRVSGSAPVKIAIIPDPASTRRIECHCEWIDGWTTFPMPSQTFSGILFLAPPIPHAPPITVHSFFRFENCHPRNLIPLLDVDQTSHGSDTHLSHILSFHQILGKVLLIP